MPAYYNEIDPFAAQWLRNLINEGIIAPGVVDERSIEDIKPNDLRGFTQCHFFAGIGIWSYALRCAGWPDDRPVWTGSCPCQPFSAAGKRNGVTDERHLWPAFYYLIQQRKPYAVFGEQVASNDGLQWVDVVRTDMEAENYAFAAFDLCAAGIGAPHIRQRLYWVADSNNARLEGWRINEYQRSDKLIIGTNGMVSGMVQPDSNRCEERNQTASTMGQRRSVDTTSRPNHFWSESEWVYCRDEKFRPIEPGTFPLVDGNSGNMGAVRAYGNAIVAPLATAFIGAYLNVNV